jgi:outer membrane receptor protein involved in Fe transport
MKYAASLAALGVAIAGSAAAQTAPEITVPDPPEASAAQQAVTVYGPEFFTAARPNTALDMVQRLPGFSFESGSSVRGFSGSAGNVLIDGERPLTKTETLDETLRRIPAATVARVEVIRGGAPGIDMQGRTILANVVRRPGGGGGIAYSEFFLWDGRGLPGIRAEYQRREGTRAWEASLVIGQGPDDTSGDGDRIRVAGDGAVLIRSHLDTQGHGTRYWLGGAYETRLWGGHLRLNALLQNNPFKADYVDVLSTPGNGGVETEQDSIHRNNYEFGARYTRHIGPFLFEGLLLEQFGENSPHVAFQSPSVTRVFDLRARTGETIARTALTLRTSPTLSFEFGAEGAFNWLSSRTTLTVNNAPVVLPAANVRVEELRGELSAIATWQPFRSLNLETGLRFEASTITSAGDTELTKTLSFPKPRVVATWSPTPSDQLRVRFEREIGQLNFNDFVASSSVANTGTAIAGNPDINPQQAWVIEAAYERRFWRNGLASATLRHYQLTDVVDRIPLIAGNTVIDAPGNIGDGTRTEATLALSVPLERFGLRAAQVRGAITWRRSRVTDPVTGEERPISFLHPLDWEIHFTHDLPRWRVNYGIDVNGVFNGNYNGYRETSYRVTEIVTRVQHTFVVFFGEYKPRPNLILRWELQNALGRDFILTRQVYSGPRNTSPLAYVDVRHLRPGPALLLRVRRTF